MGKIGKGSLISAILLLLLMLTGLPASLDIKDFPSVFFGENHAIQCSLSRPPWEWVSLAGFALAIGVFFNAGVMSLSGVLGGQKYNEFVKGGLWGLVETAALLGIFSLAFVGLQEAGEKNLNAARAYSVVTRNTIAFDFLLMVSGSTVFSFIARQAPTIRMPIVRAWGVSFQLSPMFRPIFDALGLMVQLLSGAIAAWVGNEFLLCFIKTNMLTMLLPIGFFLRAFGLNGGGNALLGMSLALYFVYPLMLIAAGQMISNYFTADMTATEPAHIWASCSGNKPICCLPSNPYPANFGQEFIPNGPNWRTSLGDRLMTTEIYSGDMLLSLQTAFVPTAAGKICIFNTGLGKAYGGILEILSIMGIWTLPVAAGSIAILNKVLLQYMNLSWVVASLAPIMTIFVTYSIYEITFFLFIVSLIIPITILFVTLTVAKEITKALGTEIDLSSLEKLI